jgi:hypothetical protein
MGKYPGRLHLQKEVSRISDGKMIKVKPDETVTIRINVAPETLFALRKMSQDIKSMPDLEDVVYDIMQDFG